MARSILAIAQEAAERDNTAPAPATLFGTNDRISKLLRGGARDTIRDIMRKATSRGLSDLHSTWGLVLQPGIYAYDLPPDFLRIIPNTEYRGGSPLNLVGPATPQSWSAMVFGGGIGSATSMTWRIRNNMIVIAQTPTAQELVTIEYISRYPVVSPIRTGDYDMSSYPPQAIAPVVPRDGHIDGDASEVIYESQSDFEYESEPGWDAALWTAEMSEILRRVNPLAAVGVVPQVRRETFTDDADFPAFDDDHLLSLGMTMRLRRGLGLAYAEQMGEYEEEMEMKFATDAGGTRPFLIGGGDETADVLPVGNGRWILS
ncbi:MAG: hypothetical protein E6R03_01810 [Hyphomicrobiaceae bacterium]|nr:MAG: hypothetical protein E6R03_01810 [Hyphomicrobiaceae bacterium]